MTFSREGPKSAFLISQVEKLLCVNLLLHFKVNPELIRGTAAFLLNIHQFIRRHCLG